MGYSSNLEDEEIQVIDKEGLKEYLKRDNELLKALLQEGKDEWSNIDIECFSFNGWDGHKIISYWYMETLEILRDLAVFIEGYVRLRGEDDEQHAYITFEKGKCKIRIGITNWGDCSLESLWHDFKDKKSKMPPLSDELTARLVARNL